MSISRIGDLDLAALIVQLCSAFPIAASLGCGELFARAAENVAHEIRARRSGVFAERALFDDPAIIDLRAAPGFFLLLSAMTAELAEIGFKEAAAALREHAAAEVTLVPPPMSVDLAGIEMRTRH